MSWYHHCVPLFWIYYLNSIPHRAVGTLLFWCCVWLFFSDFWSVVLFFLLSFLICRSLLSVAVSCLLLVVSALPCCHPWRSYVVLRLFRLIFLDHWYHTYQFCYSRKLWSFFVPPRCCSFFSFLIDSVDLRCPLSPTLWYYLKFGKNCCCGGSWSAAGNSLQLPWHFLCLLMSSCVAFYTDLVLFASSLRFWLQHQGLTGPIGFLILSSDAG